MQCIFIFLLAFYKTEGIEEAIFDLEKEECRKIKCPPKLDPVCAKVSMEDYLNKRRLTMDWDILGEDVPIIKNIYITMVNKCQMEIMNCNQDVKVEVVSMHFCDKQNEGLNTELGSKLTKRSKREATQANMEEYYAECPKVCPARDVMVCAKCQHGVHRTFTSVCHMRMFSCLYKNEKLKLVSRTPCVMSSPFLTKDLNMEPRGRVLEPYDQDFILQYIICRDNKDDDNPHCKGLRKSEN